MRVITRAGALLTVAVVMGALASSCQPTDVRTPTPAGADGDQGAGRAAIIQHGCGSCHRVPGIPNAVALVGPPLDSWSQRSFIAGTLPNTVDNMVRWLDDPQAVRPGSAMPRLDLDERELIDITAYLFSLD